MKKSLYEKSTGQDIPNKLEGKVTQDDILEKIKESCENLYNSAPSNESMNVIKGDISKSLRENILLSEAVVDMKLLKVLSPHLFSACYLDDLIAKLRKMDLGCQIAG